MVDLHVSLHTRGGLLSAVSPSSMVKFFISMNNAIKKNYQLLRDQQKFEFSLFAVHFVGSTEIQSELLMNMYVRSYSTLAKKME